MAWLASWAVFFTSAAAYCCCYYYDTGGVMSLESIRVAGLCSWPPSLFLAVFHYKSVWMMW